jgi:hypothetical protein
MKAGFHPLRLRITRMDISLAGGTGCEWDTLDTVPDAPGVYAFTLHWPTLPQRHVMYVGQTDHLWMVTKGRLPGGEARGGQRYGHPRHAGVTRQRINLGIAGAVRMGWVPEHWVRPVAGLAPDVAVRRRQLRALEEYFIAGWRLRAVGWNVG